MIFRLEQRREIRKVSKITTGKNLYISIFFSQSLMYTYKADQYVKEGVHYEYIPSSESKI